MWGKQEFALLFDVFARSAPEPKISYDKGASNFETLIKTESCPRSGKNFVAYNKAHLLKFVPDRMKEADSLQRRDKPIFTPRDLSIVEQVPCESS